MRFICFVKGQDALFGNFDSQEEAASHFRLHLKAGEFCYVVPDVGVMVQADSDICMICFNWNAPNRKVKSEQEKKLWRDHFPTAHPEEYAASLHGVEWELE